MINTRCGLGWANIGICTSGSWYVNSSPRLVWSVPPRLKARPGPSKSRTSKGCQGLVSAFRHAHRTERISPQVQQIDIQGFDHFAQGALRGLHRLEILATPHLENDVTTYGFHSFTSTT